MILKIENTGLTIQELAEKTGVSRITAALALQQLVGGKKVHARSIGNCKLHYWEKRKKPRKH